MRTALVVAVTLAATLALGQGGGKAMAILDFSSLFPRAEAPGPERPGKEAPTPSVSAEVSRDAIKVTALVANDRDTPLGLDLTSVGFSGRPFEAMLETSSRVRLAADPGGHPSVWPQYYHADVPGRTALRFEDSISLGEYAWTGRPTATVRWVIGYSNRTTREGTLTVTLPFRLFP